MTECLVLALLFVVWDSVSGRIVHVLGGAISKLRVCVFTHVLKNDVAVYLAAARKRNLVRLHVS